MFRGHDVEASRTDSRKGVVDGGHTRVECRHARCSRQLPHTFLQIGYRGVGNAGIRRGHGTTAKCVAHGLGRLKLKRRRIVDGHRQCPVCIRFLILRRQDFRFVIHLTDLLFYYLRFTIYFSI